MNVGFSCIASACSGKVRPAIAIVGAFLVLATLAEAPARAQEDLETGALPDWCASKWGPADEIGAANLLSNDRVVDAAKLVKTGKTYGLGIETNARTPAFAPRFFHLTILQPGQVAGETLGPSKTSYNDDLITGWVGVGSQIDGLGHIGIDHVYYNCNRAAEFAKPDGLSKLGIEKIPPIVARGIVLDMTAILGADPLPAGTAINREAIKAAAERQDVTIGQGDVVLLHTGWLGMALENPDDFTRSEPGLGRDGARYLASLDVLAVGADQWALEVIPFEDGVGTFEIHQILLAQNGIYILENMNTAPLVADEAWEFLFVLGVSRITGAVQGIVNPVAIR